MSNYQTLLTDVSDKVATIWLNRPEHRNAFSPDMTRELHEAFGAFEARHHGPLGAAHGELARPLIGAGPQ